MIRVLARLLAAVHFSKEPGRTYYFHSVQTSWHHTDSGPAEPKTNTASSSCSPGSDLAKSDSLRRESTDLRVSVWLGTTKIDLGENLSYFGIFS